MQVDYERKQEAKRRKKAEEEARKRKEAAALTKAMLEAAFDGEDEELMKLLGKAKDIMKHPVRGWLTLWLLMGNNRPSPASAAGRLQ